MMSITKILLVYTICNAIIIFCLVFYLGSLFIITDTFITVRNYSLKVFIKCGILNKDKYSNLKENFAL